ncbi:MAG: cyclic nucleotide-binding domain-containing protein [Spirochaetes bacterium]|nr:cyclic nucleotide-binding domain-containing protein [Spirochaetota bacterium]
MGLFSNVMFTKEDEEIAKILTRINIFKGLTPFERAKISRYFRKREYNPGEMIVKEGQSGDRMYVIREGAVKVAKSLSKSKEQVLANLVDGDFFGDMALLDGSPRSASVYAISKVKMLELYRASLQEFIDREPRIGVKMLYNVARILAERIRASGDKIKDILLWKMVKTQK